MPKFSIIIPQHDMANRDFFLKRCLESIEKQTYKDYEILQIEQGSFAKNVNIGILASKGELIKFLCMDDWLVEDSLERIAKTFKNDWLITGCDNNPHPYWTDDIYLGNNHLGSPSALTIENKEPLFFDENLKWLVDCDYCKRLYDRYGQPTILDEVNVNIGIGEHQMTHQISDEIKIKEFNYMKEKYG